MALKKEFILPVSKFREFLRDFKEENDLTELEENTDIQLQRALEDALDYINTAYPPLTKYTITGIPSWTVVRDRGVLNVLVSNMIRSGRNMFQYNDQGGVNVVEDDVYGRYVNLYNMLLAKNEMHIKRFKMADNVEGAYGGVDSEYVEEYHDRY